MVKKIINEEAIKEFEKILNDDGIPKNIKTKISNIISIFNEREKTVEFKTSKILEELDEISEETNIPEHLRTQIWNIVSILESAE